MAGGFAVGMIAAVTFGFLAMAGLDSGAADHWLVCSAGMAGWLVASTRSARRMQ